MKSSFSPEEYQIFLVGAASPDVAVGNPEKNVGAILDILDRKDLRECRFVVLPELCLTGYTCGDLFMQENLQRKAVGALLSLAASLENDNRLIAVGLPVVYGGKLYNCAATLCNGEILGIVPKINIPNYQEFYEKRWFHSGQGVTGKTLTIGDRHIPFGTDLIFNHCGVKIGIEICEDLWVPIPPSSILCGQGAEMILNLSATDDNIGKYNYIKSLVASQSARCRCGYAYASAGRGESSTDLVFSGIDLIGADGEILAESPRFPAQSSFSVATVDIGKLRNERLRQTSFNEYRDETPAFREITAETICGGKQNYDISEYVRVSPHPFIPGELKKRDENCSEIISIQSWGLGRRLDATGCRDLIVGISGGLDSTLALLVAHHTFELKGLEPKGIRGVTMPAEATSARTHDNAWKLMMRLGVTPMEIPVKEAVSLHFRDIGQNPENFDATYENSQARERTQILMDLANKHSGMVLGTGDMSELALGWCTYNGDHMSMYNVNGGVPKTLVKHLVRWFADKSEDKELKEVLLDIIDTPISPELVPSQTEGQIAQKTEELVGPYELHDFFLFHMIRNSFSPGKIFMLARIAFEGKYSPAEIKKWLTRFYSRFFSQQFKRSCMPDGPKIGSVCLSPRGDWRMPSDASATLWIKEAENLAVD